MAVNQRTDETQMDGIDLFIQALAQATAVIKQVRVDQLVNDTPDTEWNVRDVVGHMLYELAWVPDITEGATIEEVGAAHEDDLLENGAALSAIWQAMADQAEQAASEADPDETAHLSYGDRTIDEYLWEAGTDLLIHAWDVAAAIGMPLTFDYTIAQEVYKETLPRTDELSRTGLFAKALKVPDTADLQTKLLALFGRDAHWHAS